MNRPMAGQYDVNHSQTKPRPKSAFIRDSSMRFAPENMEHTRNPGPGNYSGWNASTKVSIAKFTVSKQKRKDIFEDEIRKANEMPGPYKHKDTFEQNKNKTFEFGKPFKTVYDQNPPIGKYSADQTANFMQKNMKIDKAPKKDIWAESVLKAKSVPEANYRHVDTFEANKKKTHEFGKPFKTVYNKNPSPDKYQPDVTKNLMNTSKK